MVDVGTAGLTGEKAPPGCWPGQHSGDGSRMRAHEDSAL